MNNDGAFEVFSIKSQLTFHLLRSHSLGEMDWTSYFAITAVLMTWVPLFHIYNLVGLFWTALKRPTVRQTSVRVTHPCTNRTQHCLTSVSQRNYHNSMPHSQYSSIHKPVISIVRNFSLFCLYCLHLNIVSLNSFVLKRPTVRQTSVMITHPFTNRAQRCVSFSEHLLQRLLQFLREIIKKQRHTIGRYKHRKGPKRDRKGLKRTGKGVYTYPHTTNIVYINENEWWWWNP